MQPGTPSPRETPPVSPTEPHVYTGQWRPGRLLIALVVMIGVVVAAWFVTQ